MIKRISVLDDLTINKIAAGEVVERPSSVVKELMENALDANSSRITIEINEGGKDFIKIIDNGDGIHPEDIEVAFNRHSTSKIKTIEDIDHLSSNGFRGEALSSISSVAKVELITNTDDALLGREAKISDGRVQEINTVGSKKGTTLTVSDIFYNVPARKKFLRSTATETAAISDIASRLALINHHVAIKYISNGREVFSTAGDGKMLSAIASVYGRALTTNLVPVHYSSNTLEINGFVSNTTLYQSNRKKENIFINKRYIKMTPLTYVIENIYKGIIPLGKFPVFFLDIGVKPHLVDPNVHPSKLEVKISSELDISGPLTDAIKGALFQSSGHLIPKAGEKSFLIREEKDKGLDGQTQRENLFEYQEIDVSNAEESQREVIVDSIQGETDDFHPKDHALEDSPVFFEKMAEFKKANELADHFREAEIQYEQAEIFEEKPEILDYNLFSYTGIIFNTYIIVTYKESAFLIDQHAAHERVMFEKIRQELNLEDPKRRAQSQELLLADIKEYSFMEHEVILNNKGLLWKMGFDTDDFGFNRIAIRSYPILFGMVQDQGLFDEVVSFLAEEKTFHLNEVFLNKIASMACKKAVKANQVIGEEEVKLLLSQLEECSNKYTCPHGRPIFVELKKYEIEKMFKRIV